MLALVMPAYNEAECVEEVIRGWLTILDRVPGKFIVVNDGSRDDTGKILDRLAASEPRLEVVHQANAGHGAAVLNGYRRAVSLGAEWVFQTDSDDQFYPEDFWKLWNEREKAAILIGTRANRADPRGRKMISFTMRWMNVLVFGVYNRDANSPFRLMRGDVLGQILKILPATVFAPNIFLLVIARKARVPILEMGVRHKERQTGVVSILRWKLLKVCLRSAQELLSFRIGLLGQGAELKKLGQMANGPRRQGLKNAG